jgi:rhodanese-related sulfurtransferase
MGSWNRKFVGEISKHLSNKYANRIDTNQVFRPQAGNLPNQNTENIVQLLDERLDFLLADTITNIIISPDELFANLDDYFVLAYWSKEKYTKGHISGSFQYDIRSELSPNVALNTLPVDKRIVVYCNTGHHAIAIVAYLKLLGYDAVSMMYGINSFMNLGFQKIAPGAAITDANALAREFPILEGEDRTSNPLKTERDRITDFASSCRDQSGFFPRANFDNNLSDIIQQFVAIERDTVQEEIKEIYIRENL